MKENAAPSLEHATLGGGCFWCVEAVFQRIEGVVSVRSGYSGGSKNRPTYEEVCAGETGHAEVVQIAFDPARITFGEILDIFWQAHDPTTKDRQGADAGTQYRSIILYHDEKQKLAAEESLKKAQGRFRDPIVTRIEPLETFWEAEGYHQKYYDSNRNAGYCRVIISPKLRKLRLE
jgi:peptide-methionine (S)-S-oxide reductase